MVEKRNLFLLFALIGIFFLLVLSNILEPKLITIKEITEKNLNQQVKVKASVISLINIKDKNFQILTLRDKTANITAIANSLPPSKINKTLSYLITGKVQQYKSDYTNKTELQISINKIEEIRE